MIQNQRVIYNTSDISTKVNDYRAGTQAFSYTSGQYLYIGSVLPMNNIWFEMSPVNNVATTVSIQIWWGNAWHNAVDIIDETSGLNSTGRIQWSTDRLKGWDIEQDSKDVTGLESFSIYWKYWLRLSWANNFGNSPQIKYVGQKYSIDDVLYSFYPDLSNANILEGFESGKTSWDEQHYFAAECIEKDLRKRNIIKSRNQILDWSLLQEASCHKVAETCYRAFGQPYAEQLLRASKDYSNALNLSFYNTDQNANGNLDPDERNISTHFVTR
jgi:hypothetical protein